MIVKGNPHDEATRKVQDQKLVDQYAEDTKVNFGVTVNTTTHFNRIYADYQAGLVTVEDIEAETK